MKYCQRPWAADPQAPTKDEVLAMGEALIANWNAVVQPDDVVYNLGDLAYRTSKAYVLDCVSRLNGTISHVPGNHDDLAFRLHLASNYATYWHNDIYEITPIEEPAQKIILCHYAMREWQHCLRGTWHLFGHTHATLGPFGKSVDVGVDNAAEVLGRAVRSVEGSHALKFAVTDEERRSFYRPLSFVEIKAFMDTREIGDHASFCGHPGGKA